MRIAIAAAPRARAKAEAEVEAGNLRSLDLTGDGGPFRSGGRRREGARGIGDLGFRGRAAGCGSKDHRRRREERFEERKWGARRGAASPRRWRPPRSTAEAARSGRKRGRCGWKASKPERLEGEATTRLFYVAEEFVEAARIFGDFLLGRPTSWNECGGRINLDISPNRHVAKLGR